MKKIDIFLSLITGTGISFFFLFYLKNSFHNLPFFVWLLAIFFPFLALFAVWIACRVGERIIFLYQLTKFLLVGSFFSLIELAILNLLMVFFGINQGILYIFFVVISFFIATSLKYFGDKYWAFEKFNKSKLEFTKFFVFTLGSVIIQVLMADLIVNKIGTKFGFNPLVWANIGKIAGISIASIWNFLVYKFIVFKK